jgi:hypothetical protein
LTSSRTATTARVVHVFGKHVHGIAVAAHGNELPALLDRDRGSDLTQHVDATLERRDRLRNVELHRRGDHHRIQGSLLEHVIVVKEEVLDSQLGIVANQTFLIDVAECLDLDRWDALK